MDKFLEWIASLDITTTFANLGILVGAISSIVVSNNSVKKTAIDHNDKVMKEMAFVKGAIQETTLEAVRTELNQALDHDYGDEIVTHLYSRYKMLGGNSYMTAKVKKYFEDKPEEWEEHA